MMHLQGLDHHNTLDTSSALERLRDELEARREPPETLSRAELETLEVVVELIDGLPQTLEQVARAMASSSVRQVYIKLKHDIFHDALDPAGWGFSWDALEESMRDVLAAMACGAPDFARDDVARLSGQPDADQRVTELLDAGWVIRAPHEGAYTMCWSIRMLVRQHLGAMVSWRSRHALDIVARFEEVHEDFESFEVAQIKHAFEYAKTHDMELAARLALILFYAMRRGRSTQELVNILEFLTTRRPCLPGDLLGVELYGRLGEMYLLMNRVEQAIETLELAIALEPPKDHALYGGLHMALAKCLSFDDQFERANDMVALAIDSYTQLGLDSHRQRAIVVHANILSRSKDYEGAIHIYEALLLETPDDVLVRGNLGAMYQATGRLDEAYEHLEVSTRLYREEDNYRGELISLNNVIPIDLLRDDRHIVERRLKRVEQLYTILGTDALTRYISLRNRALHMQQYGSLLEAYHLISEALECDRTQIDAMAMRMACAAHLGFLDEAALALDELRTSLPHQDGRSHLVYAELAMRCGRVLHDPLHDENIASVLQDVQAAQQTYCSCLSQLMLTTLHARAEALEQTDATLWLTTKAEWARRGEQPDEVDLRRSAIARHLLLALVAHHQAHPRTPCPVETLFEAAWPGQRWNVSARTRLHTAIHRLRERLLGDLLITHDDLGYSISSHCKIKTFRK